jgi:hypothetical protein
MRFFSLKETFLLVLLIIISLFGYGIIHELTHFTACKIVGLDSKIEINLLTNPPTYKADCSGINEKTAFEKFLFWGSPYIISLITMILLLIYLKKDKFYLIGISAGIFLSNILNLWGLYEWTFRTGQAGNDLLNILFKTNRVYYLFIIFILGLIAMVFIFDVISFALEFRKRQESRE